MLKSIYTPASGALTQERVIDILANNLANMNTGGFKQDKVSFEVLEPEPYKHYNNPLPPANYKFDVSNLWPLRGNEVRYVGVSDIARDTSQGPAIETRNQTDIMIDGGGYFEVQTGLGPRLTRDGAFTVNPEGILVTKTGDTVMGTRGSIPLKAGPFSVNHRGEVYQGGQLIDSLKIVKPIHEKSLERVGHNHYHYQGAPEDLVQVEHPQIKQGFIEGSNVNAIKNLTALILAQRSFEAYQKAISNYDQIMEKSSNSIGDTRV